jgi:hypothetical protein
MKHATLHSIVLVTGLVTGLIHLVLLSLQLGELSFLFILNGLGYLALVALFFVNPSFIAERRNLMHYAFIAYTAVTILAWLPAEKTLTGYVTKIDEVILIAALFMHLRSSEGETA